MRGANPSWVRRPPLPPGAPGLMAKRPLTGQHRASTISAHFQAESKPVDGARTAADPSHQAAVSETTTPEASATPVAAGATPVQRDSAAQLEPEQEFEMLEALIDKLEASSVGEAPMSTPVLDIDPIEAAQHVMQAAVVPKSAIGAHDGHSGTKQPYHPETTSSVDQAALNACVAMLHRLNECNLRLEELQGRLAQREVLTIQLVADAPRAGLSQATMASGERYPLSLLLQVPHGQDGWPQEPPLHTVVRLVSASVASRQRGRGAPCSIITNSPYISVSLVDLGCADLSRNTELAIHHNAWEPAATPASEDDTSTLYVIHLELSCSGPGPVRLRYSSSGYTAGTWPVEVYHIDPAAPIGPEATGDPLVDQQAREEFSRLEESGAFLIRPHNSVVVQCIEDD